MNITRLFIKGSTTKVSLSKTFI